MKISHIVFISTLLGCSGPADDLEIRIIARVTDDYGEPFSGAIIKMGDVRGETGPEGSFETSTSLPEGSPVAARVVCSSGHRPVGGDNRTITIRYLRNISRDTPGLSPMEVHFVCEPMVRDHVLIVKTDGRSGLPILVTGDRVGTTDADGLATHVVTGAPGDEIRVVIDTSDQPRLRPAQPSRRLVLPARSRFLIFDQAFEEKKVTGRKKRKRRKTRTGPRRL